MEKDRQEWMNRLEIFDYLMGIFDRWTEAEPERYGGSFKSLKKGICVRDWVITPNYSIRMPMLKTYFATEVLKIYQWDTRSKVSWKDIQRSLAGNAKKKYCFDFKELDKCFSAEENKNTAEKTQLLEGYAGFAERAENWKDVPIYLLHRLQELFREKLGHYWRLCDMEQDDPEVRRESYKECVIMLSLHEIFVREYSATCSKWMEEARERRRIFNSTFDQLSEKTSQFREMKENEKKALTGQVKDQTQEYGRWMEEFWTLQLLCLEHSIAVEAEIQLVMLLELKKLDDMKGHKENSLWHKAEVYLAFMKDKYLDDYADYNRNKVKFYRQLEADVQKIFLRFMSNIPVPEKKAVSGAIRDYLEITARREEGHESREALWQAQCMIVRSLITDDLNPHV